MTRPALKNIIRRLREIFPNRAERVQFANSPAMLELVQAVESERVFIIRRLPCGAVAFVSLYPKQEP